MPELPDLTLYAKNLKKKLLNRPIRTAEVFHAAKVNVPAAGFSQALKGQQFTDIERDGKELLFHLSNGERLAVHLMLFGKCILLPAYTDAHGVNGKLFLLGFEDGGAFAVSDYRGMARATLNPRSNPAPDALSEDLTLEAFQALIQKRPAINIKALLIDQKVIKGIGNAYVDEILYQAHISPKSIAGKIPDGPLQDLYEAIGEVLRDAIKQIERLQPDIISGEERSFLKVHKPRTAQTNKGETIHVEEIAGKRTYYTDSQVLYA